MSRCVKSSFSQRYAWLRWMRPTVSSPRSLTPSLLPPSLPPSSSFLPLPCLPPSLLSLSLSLLLTHSLSLTHAHTGAAQDENTDGRRARRRSTGGGSCRWSGSCRWRSHPSTSCVCVCVHSLNLLALSKPQASTN
jgi:hypothetical protein